MSIEALTWVFQYSPYKLGARLVHIAIADVVNADHDWEVWLSQSKIAKKANLSTATVSTSMAQMIEDGYLEIVDQQPGKRAVYRFLTPPDPLDSKGSDNHDDHEPPKSTEPTPQKFRGVPPKNANPDYLLTEVNLTQVNTRREKSDSLPLQLQTVSETDPKRLDPLYGFESFWQRYPKRNGKRLEKSKAQAIWKKLSLEDARAAYRGARNYGKACDDGLTIAKDPHRWLRDRNWGDWEEPAVADKPQAQSKPDLQQLISEVQEMEIQLGRGNNA